MLLGELKAQYRKGGLGDSVLKRRLNDNLQALVGPIRERRERFAADRGEVARMLRIGTAQARERVAATVAEVKGALGLTYF
jgi:tryptophanyl-tRNA synthetase